MRNFGLHKTVIETENSWSELIGFILVSMLITVGVVSVALLIWLASMVVAWPRDLDGKYSNSPLKPWFDQLASKKGLCCSFADGVKIENVDWDTLDGQYRVRLDDQWIVVPESALITEANRFGPAVVWPYRDAAGATQIRCFMPGAGA